MAFVKPAEDASGNEYPNAFWYPDAFRFIRSERELFALYRPWKDAESFAAGLAPIPGLSRAYVLRDAEFLATFAAYQANPTDLGALIDAHALATADEPSPAGPVSFFAGLTRV